MNKILSYRGLLTNADQETILLSTKKGEIGYRIRKLQVITNIPGNTTQDLVVKIYKVEQESVPSSGATIDFSDNTLLAVGHYSGRYGEISPDSVIFGNEIFNQDIYVTHTDQDGNDSCNYYLELEVMTLNETEATVATLKDIRNNQ
jgi:hypothetical protein